MHNLRDEPILTQHFKETPTPHLQYKAGDLSAQDCQFYGHSWKSISTAGAKCCTVCGITGFCPGCTPVAPSKAASQDYEQFLAERIAGDSAQQAHKYLLNTGFITQVTVTQNFISASWCLW